MAGADGDRGRAVEEPPEDLRCRLAEALPGRGAEAGPAAGVRVRALEGQTGQQAHSAGRREHRWVVPVREPALVLLLDGLRRAEQTRAARHEDALAVGRVERDGHLREDRAGEVAVELGYQHRAQGAHYTTEKNILKVIEPLFLDDLRAEFRRLQARRDGRAVADLRRFRDKLGSLRLFDPACGCGNFLIVGGSVAKHTTADTKLYTDESHAYRGFGNREAVKHRIGEYVRGDVSTKLHPRASGRCSSGATWAFHRMSLEHPHRYVAEFEGRHNARDLNTADQLGEMVRAGKSAGSPTRS